MRIGIATHHGGYCLKQELLVQLLGAGHEVIDYAGQGLGLDDDYSDHVPTLPSSRDNLQSQSRSAS